jgi:hypothetical protein
MVGLIFGMSNKKGGKTWQRRGAVVLIAIEVPADSF